MNGTVFGRIWRIAKLPLLALLGYFAWRHIDTEVLWSALTTVEISWWVLGSILIGTTLLIRARRWQRLLRPWFVSYGQAMRSLLVGTFLTLFVPGSLGELGRFVVLPEVPPSAAGGRALVDKLCDVGWLALLAIGGVGWVLKLDLWWITWTMTFAGYLLILIFPSILLLLPRICLALPGLRKLAIIGRLRQALISIEIRDLRANLLLVACGSLPYYAGVWCLFRAFDYEMSLPLLSLAPWVTFSLMIPLTIGGLGIREFTALLLYGSFQLQSEIVLNAYFLVYFAGAFVPGMIGWLLWSLHRQRSAVASEHSHA